MRRYGIDWDEKLKHAKLPFSKGGVIIYDEDDADLFAKLMRDARRYGKPGVDEAIAAMRGKARERVAKLRKDREWAYSADRSQLEADLRDAEAAYEKSQRDPGAKPFSKAWDRFYDAQQAIERHEAAMGGDELNDLELNERVLKKLDDLAAGKTPPVTLEEAKERYSAIAEVIEEAGGPKKATTAMRDEYLAAGKEFERVSGKVEPATPPATPAAREQPGAPATQAAIAGQFASDAQEQQEMLSGLNPAVPEEWTQWIWKNESRMPKSPSPEMKKILKQMRMVRNYAEFWAWADNAERQGLIDSDKLTAEEQAWITEAGGAFAPTPNG